MFSVKGKLTEAWWERGSQSLPGGQGDWLNVLASGRPLPWPLHWTDQPWKLSTGSQGCNGCCGFGSWVPAESAGCANPVWDPPGTQASPGGPRP